MSAEIKSRNKLGEKDLKTLIQEVKDIYNGKKDGVVAVQTLREQTEDSDSHDLKLMIKCPSRCFIHFVENVMKSSLENL